MVHYLKKIKRINQNRFLIYLLIIAYMALIRLLDRANIEWANCRPGSRAEFVQDVAQTQADARRSADVVIVGGR